MYDKIWNLDYRQFFCHIAVVTREEETCVSSKMCVGRERMAKLVWLNVLKRIGNNLSIPLTLILLVANLAITE